MAQGQSNQNLSQYLNGVSFPSKRDDLLNFARQQNADQTIISQLQNLPADQQFNSLDDVMQGIGQV